MTGKADGVTKSKFSVHVFHLCIASQNSTGVQRQQSLYASKRMVGIGLHSLASHTPGTLQQGLPPPHGHRQTRPGFQ